MDSLLTLSIGEYSSAEIVIRLTAALAVMAAALLALSTSCVRQAMRFPLILSAVALGGAAWFEMGVWSSWKEAFELAGTSYAVTGQLMADQDRIIAWSLGVPALLFSLVLSRFSGERKNKLILLMGGLFLALALAAPFSSILAIVILAYAAGLLFRNKAMKSSLEITLSVAFVFAGLAFSSLYSWHPFSFGGGVSGELVRGEIIRSLIDLFSLVVPALLLLIGTLRLSTTQGSDS